MQKREKLLQKSIKETKGKGKEIRSSENEKPQIGLQRERKMP